VLLAAVLMTGALLAGCSSDTKTKMSEKDKANFAGGPMPASYKDPYLSRSQPAAANGAANPARPEAKTK
jgi:hypothetical protein